MVHPYTIAIDFDGVLHKYTGWNNGILNDPVAGAREAITKLKANGCDLVIYTTRGSVVVKDWLEKHGLPDIRVAESKPMAHVYLDDRAYRFDGVWSDKLIDDIQFFKTYWERGFNK